MTNPIIEEIPLIKCSRCAIEKAPQEYYKNSRHCKSCHNEMQKRWQERNIEKHREYQREYAKRWKDRNPEKHKANRASQAERAKWSAIMIYSNGMGECACCGEDNIRFLTLDHINGNGAEHRREILAEIRNSGDTGRGDMSGTRFYQWLKAEGFPDCGLQVLCFNCNCGKAYNKGVCPHLDVGSLNNMETSPLRPADIAAHS